MTKEELLVILSICNSGDTERDHSDADEALIAYINDPDIKTAYEAIEKWYD